MGGGLFFGGGIILGLGRAPHPTCECGIPNGAGGTGGSRYPPLSPLAPPLGLAFLWAMGVPWLAVPPRFLGRAPRHLPPGLADSCLPPFSRLRVPWLHPRYSGNRTSWAAPAGSARSSCAPTGPPGALSSRNRSLSHPSVIMYLWPNTDLISLISSSGSHESSTWAGNYCLLSNPMSSSTWPAPVSIQGIYARITGKISLATGGSLVQATTVISSTP